MGDKAIAIASDIKCSFPSAAQQFLKTSTAAAAPVALTATRTFFRQATILGCNTLAGVANTGNVNIGPSSSASEQPFLIGPGEEIVLRAPIGAKWNFQDWFLDVATDGDGVVVIYD